MLGLEASLVCTESPQACIAKTDAEPTRKKRLESMLKAEDNYMPTPSFLKNVQTCVNEETRARIIDLMQEGILGEQDTSTDVFQTSCNLLDRFLSKKAVSCEYHLVACAGACMMIACKIRNGLYDQHHHLTSCIPCSMNLLVAKEKEICNTLKWNVYPVVPSDFIDELLPHMKLPHKYMNTIRQHARNLSNFAVSEYYFVGVPPSLVACGAICCAVDSLLQQYALECHKTLANLTGIEQESLKQCQWNINASFEQRLLKLEQSLLKLEQSQCVQYKEDDESSDSACTPTEIRQLFFQEFQKPHSKSEHFTPTEDGSREH